MRTLSAAAMKGNKSSIKRTQKIPREGTRVRAIFDMFMSQRGQTISVKFTTKEYDSMEQLRNFYGLDIRRFANGKWCLVGEWYGPEYIDYFAQALKQEKNDVNDAKLGQKRKSSRRSHHVAQEATI